MTRLALLAGVVTFAGCGRVGFEARSDVRDASEDAAADARALPAGAVLYLPFDAAPVGNLVEDRAASHTVMCRSSCPTYTAAGARGGAYTFTSANPDVLEVPYTTDLDASSGFTIAIWVRMFTLPPGAYYCVIGKPVGAGSYNSHALCVDTAGLAFYHSGTVAGTDNLTGSPVGLGEWHHLAMTWDGTTKRGYLDGVPDGQRAVAVENDTNPISIGADLNTGTPAYAMDGGLDEALVFDRPLTPSEIVALIQ